MNASTFVWINPEAAQECRNLGFTVHKGRGENRFFISSGDNPFNPSADIRRVPASAIEEVTVRATVASQITLGFYGEGDTEMRVSSVVEDRIIQQGMFPVSRKVTSDERQRLDIRAKTLSHVLDVFVQAMSGAIKPNPAYAHEVMSKLD